MGTYRDMAHDAGYRGDEARQVAAAIEDDHRRSFEPGEEERHYEEAMIEDACGKPCDPDDACPNCGMYWQRMVEEGYWANGEWTDRGVREFTN